MRPRRRRPLLLAAAAAALYLALLLASPRSSSPPRSRAFSAAVAKHRVICALWRPLKQSPVQVRDFAYFHTRVGFDKVIVFTQSPFEQIVLPKSVPGLSLVSLDAAHIADDDVLEALMEHRCFNHWDEAEAIVAGDLSWTVAPCSFDLREVPLNNSRKMQSNPKVESFGEAMRQVLRFMTANPHKAVLLHMHGCKRRNRVMAFPNKWSKLFRVDPVEHFTKDHGLVGLRQLQIRGMHLSHLEIETIIKHLEQGQRKSKSTLKIMHQGTKELLS